MSKPINPQIPFVRIYMDIPVRTALRLDKAAKAARVAKKVYVADIIAKHLDRVEKAASRKGEED